MPKLSYRIIMLTGLTFVIGIVFTPLKINFGVQNAEAFLGVGDVTVVHVNSISDPGAVAGTVANKLTAVSTAKSLVGDITNALLKSAGQVLKQKIIERYVQATVDWINRGGQGAIIDDWDLWLKQAGQRAVGIFAEELGAGFLCSPFNLQVQISVLAPQKFAEIAGCTLDDITGNINDFLNDFKNGGWIAYRELWNPRNNYYGATLMAMDQMAREEADAKEAAQNEAIASKGFLSQKHCDANGLNCRITTPGGLVGEAAADALFRLPGSAIAGAVDVDSKSLAGYFTNIFDAAINRLTKISIDGLRGLGRAKPPTPSLPCSGFTGEAFRACAGFQNVVTISFQADKATILSQINDSLKPREEVVTILDSLITKQAELVDTLNKLAACETSKGLDANLTLREVYIENQTIGDLKNKKTSNETFLEPLVQASADLNAIEPDDTIGFTRVISDTQYLLDSEAANDFLAELKSDQERINTNIDVKLPSAQNQLVSCSG